MRSWPYYDADHDADDIHRPWWQWKLTPRGEFVMMIVGMIVAFLAVWALVALGTWVTGTQGVPG